MRPSNSPGADGPANLYNAVCLAADPAAGAKGVLVVMNEYIFSASGVTKTHTVNPQAFENPDHGPLGTIRGKRGFLPPVPRKAPSGEKVFHCRVGQSGPSPRGYCFVLRGSHFPAI